jgi:predicted TIM-barrel fold metal-dependent hydrolase
VRDGFRIIDIDTHVIPAMEILRENAGQELQARWDELGPYLRMNNAPRPDLGDFDYPSLTLNVAPYPYNRELGTKGDEGAPVAGGKDALTGRATKMLPDGPEAGVMHDNAAGRLRAMDREGIDVDLIIPGTFASASTHLDVALSRGLCEAYNRYIVDYCSEDPERLRACIIVHASDPEWSARTIRAHIDTKCVSAAIVLLPEGLPIDDPDLHPIWQAMDDADLPILHHSFFYEPPYFPGYRDIWGNVVIARAAAHPWGAQRLLSYLLMSGLMDKYQNLRVGFAEVGAGWLPFWLRRLDAQAAYMKSMVPELKQTAVEYAESGRVFCGLELYEGPELLHVINQVLGDSVVMYQSDFPHPQCEFPNSPAPSLAWDWSQIGGDDAKRRFFSGNAERYMRLL